MIAYEQPDVVDVVTHPSFRFEPIKSVVNLGMRAFIIEKPLALSRKELTRIAAVAGDAFVAVNTQYQWMPHWKHLLQALARGCLGEIQWMTASTGVDLFDQGPHLLSLLEAISRAANLEAPGWLRASDAIAPASSSSRSLEVMIGFGRVPILLSSGSRAPLVSGETFSWYQQQVQVVGTLGRLWVSLNRGWTLESNGLFESGLTNWSENDAQAQDAFFQDVAEAIGDAELERSFPSRMATAQRNMKLLFAAIESASQGAIVNLGSIDQASVSTDV